MATPADLPSPAELGFGPKFQHFYPSQVTAIDKFVFNQKRFTALAMPTGSGKSLTGVTGALLHPDVKRAIYLTSTKGLQDQLAADFQPIGLTDVRGARNYPCTAVDAGQPLDSYRRGRYHGCDEGPCHSGVFCPRAPVRGTPLRPDCLSYGARWDARRAELVSTNYSMYLSSAEYGEGLSDFDALILDEAHDADKELESFLALEISIDDAKHIGTKLLKTTDVEAWIAWGSHHQTALKNTIELRETHPPKDAEGAKDLRILKMIYGKLERLAGIDSLTWLLDLDGMRAKFAPTRVAQYAERYLFRKIPHILLMSATMTKKTLQLLGVPADDATFWECPSTFPLERRPIISVNVTPAVRVNARMNDDDKLFWRYRIDNLITPRRALGRKGIIHTVSYQRAKELLANSEHRDLMLVHDSANTRESIQRFKTAKEPLILVSPAIVTGYDFPNDECRYQIIGKVPLPDMRGPIMSARAELDKEYAGYLAIIKLIQACGRPVRNPRDWAETFIVDDTFADWFLKTTRKHCPKWFLDAISYSENYPEPLHF